MSEKEQKPSEESDNETNNSNTDDNIPGVIVQGQLLTNSREVDKDNKKKLNG